MSSNDVEYQSIKEKYDNFVEKLSNDTRSTTPKVNQESYLIKESWNSELSTNFKMNNHQYKKFGKVNIGSFEFKLPNDAPELINNFQTAINYIKKGEILTLQSCDIINSVSSNYGLKYFDIKKIKYFSGNKRIIIDFGKEALLVVNYDPKSKISNNSKIYGIIKNYRFSNTEQLYNYLISLKSSLYDLNEIKEKYKNSIKDMKNIFEEEAELTSINEISKGIDKHNGYQKYGRFFHKNTEKKEEVEKKPENGVRISKFGSVGKVNINNIENKQNENGKRIINYYNIGAENGGYNFRKKYNNNFQNIQTNKVIYRQIK